MKGKEIQILGWIIAVPLLAYAIYTNHTRPEVKIRPTVTITTESYAPVEDTVYTVKVLNAEENIEEEMYYDSLEMLACCVEAEAGNQSREGKQFVTDVILNRVKDPNFPNDIGSVIEQSNQFAVVANGRINAVEPSEETWDVVGTELVGQLNTEVLYFRTGRFSDYGTPWQQVGDHFFSTK